VRFANFIAASLLASVTTSAPAARIEMLTRMGELLDRTIGH
jgi:hypothetical protein